jgi:UDP-N-acetylmuramoyl-tripeptide--D-alanyl-D-alanine ligase
MIAAALSPKYKVLTSQGNFNNAIGVPQTLLQLDDSHEVVVIEMGMRGIGQIEYLSEIAAPTIGVITNIGPQHIELLGTIQNIAEAKAEVLQSLPEHGAAILSADDEYIDFFTDQVAGSVGASPTFGDAPRHPRTARPEPTRVRGRQHRSDRGGLSWQPRQPPRYPARRAA